MMKIINLCSGSKGNSNYIEINNIKILIDAGKNYRYLKESLASKNIDIADLNYVFITHNHSDHVTALINVLKNTKANFIVPEKLYNSLKDKDKIIAPVFFDNNYLIGDIKITALKSSHDAPDSRNYVIDYLDKKISIITDTGYINQKHFKFYYNSDVIFMESNHDIEKLQNGRYPDYLKKRILSDEGHLSNNQAGFYLTKLIGDKTKNILLIHLSEENNSPEKAINTVSYILKDYKISIPNINYAKQIEISEVILDD